MAPRRHRGLQSGAQGLPHAGQDGRWAWPGRCEHRPLQEGLLEGAAFEHLRGEPSEDLAGDQACERGKGM